MRYVFSKINIFILLALFPIISFAQGPEQVRSIQDFFAKLNGLLGSLVPVIFGIALLSFLWGVFKYSIANDPKDRKESLQFMINGIIALFVMVSVWSLVFLVREFFGFEQSTGVNWNPGAVPAGDPFSSAGNPNPLGNETADLGLQNGTSLDSDDPINLLGNQEVPPDGGDSGFPVSGDTTFDSNDPTDGFNPDPIPEF